jgi:hypothetical protein
LQVPRFRYVPFAGFQGTSVRDLVFREADADVVCCVDSHVLVQPGGLDALLAWFDAHPESRDLLQGPLWYDGLGSQVSTHFAPRWGGGMYGQWDVSDKGIDPSGPPFEIPMQGLGLFACRRAAWPGLNPRFRGFGGEEGYLHEKFRQRGGTVLCHPGVRWAHRFERPKGVPYSNVWEDRVRNYLFGWTELGQNTGEIEAHFREHIGNDEAATTLLDRAWRQVTSPLSTFDALFCRAGDAADAFPAADVAWRLEEIAVPTGVPEPQARALRWRSVLAESQRRGYAQLLVVEDSCDIDEDEMRRLDVGALTWDVLHLVAEAGHGPAGARPAAATAIRADAYSALLAHLPDDVDKADEFIATWRDWPTYLAHCCSAQSLRRLDAVVVLPPAVQDAAERPCRTPGLHIEEVDDGLVVTNPHSAMTCHLNQTAALVLQLSWGLLTSRQIAGVLADEFSLPEAPVLEVRETVATLRGIGVLT